MLRSNAIQKENRTSRQSSKISLPTGSEETVFSANGGTKKWLVAMRQMSRKLSSSSSGRTNTLQKTIKRSIACAAISMISDIIAMAIVSFIVPKTESRALSNTVYDIGTLISVFCVLGTFESYSTILTVFCRHPSATETISSVSEDSRGIYSDKFHSVSRQESYE